MVDCNILQKKLLPPQCYYQLSFTFVDSNQQRRGTQRWAVVESQVLDSEARGQGLFQLVRLIGVKHTQRVEVLLAPHLELHHILASLDLHRPRVLPARRQQEVLDLTDLLRHCEPRCLRLVSRTMTKTKTPPDSSDGTQGEGNPVQEDSRKQRIRVLGN